MKKVGIVGFIVLSFIAIGIFSISFGKEEKQENETSYPYCVGKVTAESLKIRSGIGTENNHIGLLSKNDTVHIYGKVDNWYIVKTQSNLVGAVFADYIEASYETEETLPTSANAETIENIPNTTLSQDEQIFFNLMNNQRIEKNLPEFEMDENLLNLARLKANDIVENKYFSHTSPTLGTLFEMLDNHNISYGRASENIARNLNSDGAIESLMKSEAHRNNILSDDFNYTGIAVVNSIEYGKIFVQIFVAR